jgi:ketohexokinase
VECINTLRAMVPSATVSVEIEKPGRGGLRELANVADVVFYSRSWAEVSITLVMNFCTVSSLVLN